jgi:hypothetical protein
MIQEGVRVGREGRALIGVGRRLSCTQHPKTHGYILPQPWYEMPNVRGFPLSTGSGGETRSLPHLRLLSVAINSNSLDEIGHGA